MKPVLPPCEDFVIETIRQIRIERPRDKPGTKPGVGVHKVLKVAREFYTNAQLRSAFVRLLNGKKIVIVSEWKEYAKDAAKEHPDYLRSGTILLDRVRPFSPDLHKWAEKNVWKVDDRLGDIKPGTEPKVYRELQYGIVHVVADGLTGGALKPSRNDAAHAVMATFKKKNKKKK